MVNPVPGKSVTTPYKKHGKHWRGCGWHTGVDYAAPSGTKVVAARSGTVRHVSYGPSFGSKQVAVVCNDGSEDFYAHMRSRVPAGTKVSAGDKVGEVGSEGNSTGPHLHFERHKVSGKWNCANMDDPMKSHKAGTTATIPEGLVHLSRLVFGQKESDSVKRLQSVLNKANLSGGKRLPLSGNYLDQTKLEVKRWQEKSATDKSVKDGTKLSKVQAEQLFKHSGHTVV